MDLVVKVHGEDTLTPTINKAKQGLNGLGGSSKQLDVVRQKFQKITDSAAPMKKKLAELKKLMAEMNLDGLSNTDLFTQMAQEAGQYADAMSDASQAVRQFADDNFKLKAACEGLSAITATATITTGAMNLFGIENEKTNEAILKVQSALAVLNGVQTLSNLLNKDSALMLALKSAATAGATVTTTSLTAALSKQAIVEALVTLKQKISTAAQVAWNVAKAIGMAMLGNFTGLALLAVGAIVGITMATQDDTKATEENTDAKNKLTLATDQLKDKQEEAANTIVSAEAKVIASYKGMRFQWQQLTSEQEKSRWIEDNKSKFQQLGWQIDDVSSAEDFFNRSSSKVIEALKARAKAAAMYELYLKALQKQYELNHQTTVHYKWNYTGEVGGEDYNRQRDAARQQALDQLAEDRKAQNQFVAQLERDMLEAQRAADQAAQGITQLSGTVPNRQHPSGKGGGTTTKKEEKIRLTWEMDDHTLKFAEDYAKQLKDDLSNIPVTADNQPLIDSTRAMLDQVEKEVEARKLVLYPAVEFPEGSLDYAKAMLEQAEDVLPTLDLNIISPEQLQEALAQVEHWKQEVEKREIELGIRVKPEEKIEDSIASITEPIKSKQFEAGSTEDKRQSHQNATNILNQIKTDYSIGIIGADEAKEQIDKLNEQLEALGLKPFEFVINADTGELEEAKTKLEEAQEAMEAAQQKLSEYQDMMSNVGGAISGIGALFDEESQKAWDFAGSTIQAIAQILPQMLALFGNKAAVAMVSGIESASSLPFPANIAAIASVVATLTGVIAKAASMKKKKFATGGIVDGPTTIGDYNTVQVNGGEMILNGRQQAKLFRMLNSNTTAPQVPSVAPVAAQSFADGGIVHGATTIGDYNLAKINSGEMVLNGSQQAKLFKIINAGQSSNDNGTPSYTVKIKGSDLHLAMTNYAKTKKNILR